MLGYVAGYLISIISKSLASCGSVSCAGFIEAHDSRIINGIMHARKNPLHETAYVPHDASIDGGFIGTWSQMLTKVHANRRVRLVLSVTAVCMHVYKRVVPAWRR